MDATSDVSRRSQIFSAVPQRSAPLPECLDELFGFAEVLQRQSLKDEHVDVKYFDKHKVFLNQVNSFSGKRIVSILSGLQGGTSPPPEVLTAIGSGEDDNTKEKEIDTDKERKSDQSRKGKHKPKMRVKIKSDVASMHVPPKFADLENEDWDFTSDKEANILVNTSKFTVAEYYEMFDLDPGPDRESYLKEKIAKYSGSVSEMLSTSSPGKASSHSVLPVSRFEIIGTLYNNDNPEKNNQEGVSEIIQVSQSNTNFLKHITKCGIIIYNISEDAEQVSEANWVVNSLIDWMEKTRANGELRVTDCPLVILISSFMTWSLTKPFDPREPNLPFIEKDYTKRKPHPNYRPHFELEQNLINYKSKDKLDIVIVTSGITYGHEECVFKLFFDIAFSSADLPIYTSGENIIPAIHVDNLAHLIHQVILHRLDIKTHFVFATDAKLYTLRDIVEAISIGLGTGYCIYMPAPFPFIRNNIPQDVYDQLTANVNLITCFSKFDEQNNEWSYKTGLIKNMSSIVEEYLDYNGMKPLRIVLYSSSSKQVLDEVASILGKKYNISFWDADVLIDRYVTDIQTKIIDITEKTGSGEETETNLPGDEKGDPLLNFHRICVKSEDFLDELEFFEKLNIKHEKNSKLSEPQKVTILKKLLKKKPYIYQGYILKDFPQTMAQAERLFLADFDGRVSLGIHNPVVDDTLIPDYVIFIKMSTNYNQKSEYISPRSEAGKNPLDDSRPTEVTTPVSGEKSEETRVKNIEYTAGSAPKENEQLESEYREKLLTEDCILRGKTSERKQWSKTLNIEELPLVNFILERKKNCEFITINIEEKYLPQDIVDKISKAIEKLDFIENCSTSSSNNSTFSETIQQTSYSEGENISQITKKDSKRRIPSEEYIRLKKVEEKILAIKSYPLINYLISCIFPTLTSAILEVSKQRPEDPVDFLAEFLFKNNPDGRMMQPSQSKSSEEKKPKKKTSFPNLNAVCMT